MFYSNNEDFYLRKVTSSNRTKHESRKAVMKILAICLTCYAREHLHFLKFLLLLVRSLLQFNIQYRGMSQRSKFFSAPPKNMKGHPNRKERLRHFFMMQYLFIFFSLQFSLNPKQREKSKVGEVRFELTRLAAMDLKTISLTTPTFTRERKKEL